MGTAEIHVPTSALAYEAGIEGLTRIDEQLMRTWDLPPLYQAGIRYKREPRDVWRHAIDLVRSKWGDCEDLAAYRSAELRTSGEDPGAAVRVYRSGPSRYHAIVERGNGSFEDPSRILGMRPESPVGQLEGDIMMTDYVGEDDGDEGAPPEDYGEEPQAAPPVDDGADPQDAEYVAPRAAQAVRRPLPASPARKSARKRRKRRLVRFARMARRFVLPVTPNELRRGAQAFVGVGADPEPHDDSLTFDLYKSGRGWSGIVRLPTRAGKAVFMHTSPSPSKAAAASKATNLARLAAGNPALRAMVPPQAQAALAVLKSPIGRAVTKGLLKKFG